MSRLVPSASICATSWARLELEMPSTATMVAMPRATPTAESTARAGRAGQAEDRERPGVRRPQAADRPGLVSPPNGVHRVSCRPAVVLDPPVAQPDHPARGLRLSPGCG